MSTATNLIGVHRLNEKLFNRQRNLINSLLEFPMGNKQIFTIALLNEKGDDLIDQDWMVEITHSDPSCREYLWKMLE